MNQRLFLKQSSYLCDYNALGNVVTELNCTIFFLNGPSTVLVFSGGQQTAVEMTKVMQRFLASFRDSNE